MQRQASPAMIVIAVVIVLIVIGGLYYKFVGGGSAAPPSQVASPYGLPKSASDFKYPPPGGSGRNTITGEPLPASARPGSGPSGAGTSLPPLPPGVTVKP